MYCSKCGAENPDGNTYCGKCGTKLAEPEQHDQPWGLYLLGAFVVISLVTLVAFFGLETLFDELIIPIVAYIAVVLVLVAFVAVFGKLGR